MTTANIPRQNQHDDGPPCWASAGAILTVSEFLLLSSEQQRQITSAQHYNYPKCRDSLISWWIAGREGAPTWWAHKKVLYDGTQNNKQEAEEEDFDADDDNDDPRRKENNWGRRR